MMKLAQKAVQNPKMAARHGYERIASRIDSFIAPTVFDFEWDLLIVLDACRLDIFETVSGDYDYVDSVRSGAADSREWTLRTFSTQSLSDCKMTSYITANPHSAFIPDEVELAYRDEVWGREWDDEIGTVQPRDVTDATIAAGRNINADRTIAHYMQPHFPSVTAPEETWVIPPLETHQGKEGVFEKLRRGEMSRDFVWEKYEENLRAVLDSVQVLLNNFDADTAILTADHGNAFGEWDIYGHPVKRYHPSLRIVPWATTTGKDFETKSVSLPKTEEYQESVVKNRLEDLGYMV
jgi:hypothetical protein